MSAETFYELNLTNSSTTDMKQYKCEYKVSVIIELCVCVMNSDTGVTTHIKYSLYIDMCRDYVMYIV